MDSSSLSWKCGTCSEDHRGLPMSYGPPGPDHLLGVPERQRHRITLTDDLCVIDLTKWLFFGERHYFIRGILEIPTIDTGETFACLVWVSLSQRSFRRALQMWESPERAAEPPYFGWLCNHLTPYPNTLFLATHVHTRAVGQRPLIEVEPTDHPLAVEQRTGITLARVQEFAEILLHPPLPPQ